MEALHTWLGNAEEEFWKAHNELMDALGVHRLLEAAATSPVSVGSLVRGFPSEVRRFYTAVDWTEPFFRYLGGFHVAVWVITLALTWGPVSDERILGACAAIGVLLLSGMPLNSYAGQHADVLFQEPGVNYFTEDGIMMMIVYMLPLLVLLVGLQLRLAYRVIKLMVLVKRAQVRRRLRREAKESSTAAPEAAAAEDKKTK